MATLRAKQPPKASKELIRRRELAQSGYLFPIALAVVTLAVFGSVCLNEFTTWDDDVNVFKNSWLNPVTLDGVLHFWAHPFAGLYVPLTYTIWAVLASIARVSPDADGVTLNPAIFHFANLLLHVGTVLVVFQLLRLLSGRAWAAAMGALLFALHPVQVESVAWVTGLKDVLCGFLSLLALWQYVLFAKPGGPDPAPPSRRKRRMHYSVATFAFLLALLAKPSAITVLPAAVLVDRLFLHRQWKPIAKSLCLWLVPAIAIAVVARLAQPAFNVGDAGRLGPRLLLPGASFAFYFYRVLWPVRLAVIYPYSPRVLFEGRWIAFAWIVPVTVLIFAWLVRKRWPWLLGCVGLFLVAVLPVSGLVPFEFEEISLVADRYLYFAMIGPALALTFALADARPSKIAATACAICLAVLGIIAYLRIGSWRNTVTLFTQELAVNPDCVQAYNSLSLQALGRHDLQVAEDMARESIRLQPEQTGVFVTLGSVLAAKGQTQEAIRVFRSVCERDPNQARAMSDLGGLLASQAVDDPTQLGEAEALCRRALQIDPMLATARCNLALILAHLGRFEEALREAQRSVDLDPTDAHSQITLAVMLAQNRQPEAAAQHAMQVLQMDPNNVQARRLLESLTGPPR